jgi:hypothetical protein
MFKKSSNAQKFAKKNHQMHKILFKKSSNAQNFVRVNGMK